MAAPQRFSLNAMPGQMARLDERIQRIESALEQILQHLGMPKLEVLAPVKEPKKVIEVVKTGPYVYKPLDAAKSEIRLLILHGSADEDEPVKAQLQHHLLEDDIQPGAVAGIPYALGMFKALSYTWGNTSRNINITIDGHQFPVTENLFAALKNLRNANKAGIAAAAASGKAAASFWWIDAICINQQDFLERNEQVTLMTRIYRSSYGVHIWFGEKDERSDEAMKLVVDITSFMEVGPGRKEVVYQEYSMEEKAKHWEALTLLFQRPWWERVWVRQEVVVPRTATVQCGTKICRFDQICTVASILHTLNEQLSYQPIQLEGYSVNESASTKDALKMSCYLRASMLQELRTDLGRGVIVKYGELTDMLFHTRSCKSTDPRDKVFSVLGLADPRLYGVKPDYRITLEQAFKDVARAIITKKQSLDIMAGSQNPERENGLPSWVPNLIEEWKARPLKTKILHYSDVPDGPGFTFELDSDSILRANGRMVSSIKAVSDDQVIGDASIEQLDTLYQNWKTFVRTTKDIPGLDLYGRNNILELAKEKKNDGEWLELLSLGVEIGHWLRFSDDGKLLPAKGATAKNVYQNPEMVNNLLLPKLNDEEAIKVNPYQKHHYYLRKYGIGRRLACLSTGSVGLVPGDAREGDELTMFSNTYYAFVLRKVWDGKHVVVGEAYFPTHIPYHGLSREVEMTSFSIV